MASNRIVIDRTLYLAQRLQNVVDLGGAFRDKFLEFAAILGSQGYNQDASLATALGCSAGDQTRLQNLFTNGSLELNGLTAADLPSNSVTNIRAFLDALSTGGG